MLNLDPLLRRQLGTVMLVLGLAFVTLASILWGGHYIRRNAALSAAEASVSDCETNLKMLKANTALSGNKITATWPSLEGGLGTLGLASSGALVCPGWTMIEFCMGQACQIPGAKLDLEKVSR